MNIKYSKPLVMIIVFIFLFTFYVPHANALVFNLKENKLIDEDIVDYNRYIIKLEDEPVSVFKQRLISEGNFFAQRLVEYKNKILSTHDNVKKSIENLLDEKLKSLKIFSLEFTDLFNGIVVENLPRDLLYKVEELPYVESVNPDYKISVCLDESVPLINADDVWALKDSFDRNVTGQGISIAVIDTGVDYNHPDLKDNYVGGYDFANDDSDPLDDNGHGTHCAGIAVGNGNASSSFYTGVAPDSDLYAYKVIDASGDGYGSWYIAGMEKALSDGVDVISVSLGSSSGNPDDELSVAADNAVRAGLVVVVAAGNNGPSAGSINSPGNARKVITVGSCYKTGSSVYSTSSRGPTVIGTVKPDVVAPGVNIASALASGTGFGSTINSYYTYASGTSMATPHVAGAVALIKQMHSDWSSDEIKMAIRNNAIDIGEDLNTQGYGLIDAFASVNLSEAPPIAILNTSGEISRGLIDIYGTAIGDDFQNYSLYYSTDDVWVTLYHNDQEVNDSVLYNWDTQLMEDVTYKLKLVVNSTNYTSIDIVYIYPELQIFEGESFTISITDGTGNPINAWFLFILPYHIPRLKYGSTVTIKVPYIFNPFVKSMVGQLKIFKIIGLYEPLTVDITVLNREGSIP